MVYADIVLVPSGKGSGFVIDGALMVDPIEENFRPISGSDLEVTYSSPITTGHYKYYDGALITTTNSYAGALGLDVPITTSSGFGIGKRKKKYIATIKKVTY